MPPCGRWPKLALGSAELTTLTRAVTGAPETPAPHGIRPRQLPADVDGFVGRASVAGLPGAAERTITVNGLSKAYAMPGWRLGYAAGPADLVAAMLTVHQHTVACAGSFAQQGAVAALTGPQDAVTAMTAEYAARAETVVAALNDIPTITCGRADGAFYAFPDISATVTPGCREFARRLLAEESVAVTPGVAFGPGGQGRIRISLTSSRSVLAEVVDRIARVARVARR